MLLSRCRSKHWCDVGVCQLAHAGTASSDVATAVIGTADDPTHSSLETRKLGFWGRELDYGVEDCADGRRTRGRKQKSWEKPMVVMKAWK